MKSNRQTIAALIGGALLLGAPLARATSVNITVADNNTGSIVYGNSYVEGTGSGPGGNGIPIGEGGIVGNPGTWTTWYKGGTGPQSEYQEVEPGMQTGSQWDLAAFVNSQPGKLGVLSGYNLGAGYAGTTIGDIFVKVGSGVTPLPDPNSPYNQYNYNSAFNYDFAVHFDFTNNSYSVTQLDANTVIQNGEYAAPQPYYNSASQPWKLATTTGGLAGGDLGTVISTGQLYYTDTMDSSTASSLAGFSVTGDYKYYAEVGTNWLQPFTSAGQSVTYKLTMECGNDNMLGVQSSGFQLVPDGGATLSLLGLGVLAIAGIAKFQDRRVRRIE